MSASIHIDQNFTTFTNLDTISGQVVVRIGKPINVTAITVKLEGESRSRLLPPPGGPEKQRPQLEFHKVLYRVATVFPPDAIAANQGRGGQYTLPAGEHHYPFSFKLPFNTACLSDKSSLPAISFSGRGLEFAQPPTTHLRRPLPPTLRGFPGEAEIRYYLKATVARAGMLAQNVRVLSPFDFCPIEPPRPASDGAEAFARTKHHFVTYAAPTNDTKGKWGMFSSRSRQETRQPLGPAPHISVETRLPEPPILTINQPLPLRILVSSVNGLTQNVYLSSLQLDLIAYTHVRAHKVMTVETTPLTMLSKANMNMPLALDDSKSAFEVPKELWSGIPIHQSLCPSFETCNVARTYELIVRLGVSHGDPRGNPQLAVLSLRHTPRLFSGIAPPPELLATLPKKQQKQQQQQPPLPSRPEPGAGAEAANKLPPAYTAPPSAAAPPSGGGPGATAPSDAPPSYEDAVADSLPTVHVGARSGYVPVAARGEDGLLPTDEKRGWR